MKIEFTDSSKKQLKKIDNSNRNRILKYLFEIESLKDPRTRGKALEQNLKGLWRYRVGDYRIVCDIVDEKVTILVVKIGHRRDVNKA